MASKRTLTSGGVATGGIYHHEKEELTELQHEAMAIFSCSNAALYPGVFPGIRKFEAEIVSMVLNMMNGDVKKGHCGCLTSGRTRICFNGCPGTPRIFP